MSRQPRPDLADIPQHVVQRGNDRQPCFFTKADYLRYLTNLREAALRYDCAIHAYVLMTNHVHLLLTPASVGAVSRMMQTLGRHYVAYINTTYRRTGTLWEGRYKSCLVESESHLLTCHRYIELNPVRAAMTTNPVHYRWSSHHGNAYGHADPILQPHPSYLALGTSDQARRTAYHALFQDALDAERIAEIRAYLQQQRALGTPRFHAAIEAQLGRCGTIRPAHRPRRRNSVSIES